MVLWFLFLFRTVDVVTLDRRLMIIWYLGSFNLWLPEFLLQQICILIIVWGWDGMVDMHVIRPGGECSEIWNLRLDIWGIC